MMLVDLTPEWITYRTQVYAALSEADRKELDYCITCHSGMDSKKPLEAFEALAQGQVIKTTDMPFGLYETMLIECNAISGKEADFPVQFVLSCLFWEYVITAPSDYFLERGAGLLKMLILAIQTEGFNYQALADVFDTLRMSAAYTNNSDHLDEGDEIIDFDEFDDNRTAYEIRFGIGVALRVLQVMCMPLGSERVQVARSTSRLLKGVAMATEELEEVYDELWIPETLANPLGVMAPGLGYIHQLAGLMDDVAATNHGQQAKS